MKKKPMKRSILYVFFSLLYLACSTVSAFGRNDDEIPGASNRREPGWVTEEGAESMGGRRVALLIGVARHDKHAGWYLPYVARDIARMKDVLSTPASVGAGFEVVTLQDRDVTLDAVEARLDGFSGTLSGPEDLLLIYYSGHGVIQDRERAYYTFFTDREGDRYTKLLTEGLLAEWISRLKARAGIRVIFIGDACAPTEKVPQRRPAEVRFGDARMYAVPMGELATIAEDRTGSAFTGALVRSLAALAAQPRVHLAELFERTRRELNAPDPEEGPQLIGDRPERIILQDRNRLGFRVTAVNGITGAPLKGARVMLGEKAVGVTPLEIKDLGSGAYRIAVDREGFLRRHGEVTLNADVSGKTFEVPLYPGYLVIEGKLAGGDLEGLRVMTTGFRGSFMRDYHRAACPPDSTGAYRLFLPLDAEVTGIRVLNRIDREAGRLDLSLKDRLPEDRVRDGNRIRGYALETLTLTGSAKADIELSSEARFHFTQAERLFRSGDAEDLDIAIAYYKAAYLAVKADSPGSGEARSALATKIREAYERRFRHLMARGDHARGIEEAVTPEDGIPEAAFFTEWRSAFERENIPPSARSRLADASQALDLGQYRDAERIYLEILKTRGLTPYYRDLATENLEEIRYQLFQNGLVRLTTLVLQDRHEEALEPLALCERLKPEDPIVKRFAAKLESLRPATGIPPEFTFLRTETFAIGERSHEIRIFRHEPTALEFVLVPGGTTRIGSDQGRPDERPIHRVRIAPFLLCRTECTQEAWDRIGGTDARVFRGKDLPIEGMTWAATAEWCGKAGLRLPSESEWEHACRGGATGRFAFGDEEARLGDHAWFNGNAGERTHPVGEKEPNAFGLRDMHGNVWEWLKDIYHESYEGAPADEEARTSGSTDFRVCRGGGWNLGAKECRSAARFWFLPELDAGHLGFRPACSLR